MSNGYKAPGVAQSNFKDSNESFRQANALMQTGLAGAVKTGDIIGKGFQKQATNNVLDFAQTAKTTEEYEDEDFQNKLNSLIQDNSGWADREAINKFRQERPTTLAQLESNKLTIDKERRRRDDAPILSKISADIATTGQANPADIAQLQSAEGVDMLNKLTNSEVSRRSSEASMLNAQGNLGLRQAEFNANQDQRYINNQFNRESNKFTQDESRRKALTNQYNIDIQNAQNNMANAVTNEEYNRASEALKAIQDTYTQTYNNSYNNNTPSTNYGSNDPQALASIISTGESKQDYGVVNRGKAHGYKSSTKYKVNKMTLKQVRNMQDKDEFKASGYYQIIPETLERGIKYLNLDRNTKFDKPTQDLIFTDYILTKKKPQIYKFITKQPGAKESVAVRQLAEEWAAIQQINGVGYHDKDGVNKATIKPAITRRALAYAQDRYAQNVANGMDEKEAFRDSVMGIAEETNKGNLGQTNTNTPVVDNKLTQANTGASSNSNTPTNNKLSKPNTKDSLNYIDKVNKNGVNSKNRNQVRELLTLVDNGNSGLNLRNKSVSKQVESLRKNLQAYDKEDLKNTTNFVGEEIKDKLEDWNVVKKLRNKSSNGAVTFSDVTKDIINSSSWYRDRDIELPGLPASRGVDNWLGQPGRVGKSSNADIIVKATEDITALMKASKNGKSQFDENVLKGKGYTVTDLGSPKFLSGLDEKFKANVLVYTLRRTPALYSKELSAKQKSVEIAKEYFANLKELHKLETNQNKLTKGR